jgi:putative phosphotransacetylase
MGEKIMEKKVMVEISARHVHVTKEHLEALFGEGYELTPKKDLSQPGQFACEERVTVVGPKRQLANVSILGPVRVATQVELSATDARSIGVPIVIKESGDIEGTPGCEIIGPKGSITIDKGVMVAKRHIHMTPEDAKNYGVEDKQIVSVELNSPERKTIYGDTVVRVSEKFALAMHIDTDEGNAAAGANEGIILD